MKRYKARQNVVETFDSTAVQVGDTRFENFSLSVAQNRISAIASLPAHIRERQAELKKQASFWLQNPPRNMAQAISEILEFQEADGYAKNKGKEQAIFDEFAKYHQAHQACISKGFVLNLDTKQCSTVAATSPPDAKVICSTLGGDKQRVMPSKYNCAGDGISPQEQCAKDGKIWYKPFNSSQWRCMTAAEVAADKAKANQVNNDARKSQCAASGGTWDEANQKCIPKSDAVTSFQQEDACRKQGGVWQPLSKRCVPRAQYDCERLGKIYNPANGTCKWKEQLDCEAQGGTWNEATKKCTPKPTTTTTKPTTTITSTPRPMNPVAPANPTTPIAPPTTPTPPTTPVVPKTPDFIPKPQTPAKDVMTWDELPSDYQDKIPAEYQDWSFEVGEDGELVLTDPKTGEKKKLKELPKKTNWLLWGGIGLLVLILIGFAIYYFTKKKPKQ